MARAGCIAAVACLVGGCLSAPPDATKPSDPAADAAFGDASAAPLETMSVRVDCEVTTSDTVLEEGVTYPLIASGVIVIGTDLQADADYFWNENDPSDIRDNSNGIDLGLAIDDLSIDGERAPEWGAYRADHQYDVEFTGAGAPIDAQFHDTACGNNAGALLLTILPPAGG